MCYYTQQIANKDNLEERFEATLDNEENLYQGDFINGFSHPNIPIILDSTPDIITTNYHWGLLPQHPYVTNDNKLSRHLNAIIETVHEKPSFKPIFNNRCLILATAYYEWRHLDSKGKEKEKYQINNEDGDIFAFAGIYNTYTNPKNGEIFNTYAILTTVANEIMSYVHNIKLRMPVMLNREDEKDWLFGLNDISHYEYPPYEAQLTANNFI